jgi:glucose/arabinose dehydrogenase
LLGLNKDPNFATNHWIYLYYSDPEKSRNILTRYTLKGDVLDLNSKKVILEVATQREQCCHTGGSITFDAQGNLYLSTVITQVPVQQPMHLLMNAKEDHLGMHKNLRVIQMICVEKYYV